MGTEARIAAQVLRQEIPSFVRDDATCTPAAAVGDTPWPSRRDDEGEAREGFDTYWDRTGKVRSSCRRGHSETVLDHAVTGRETLVGSVRCRTRNTGLGPWAGAGHACTILVTPVLGHRDPLQGCPPHPFLLFASTQRLKACVLALRLARAHCKPMTEL